MDGGTRHPNLALLKIAGFLHDNHIEFSLINESDADISSYYLVYVSKVFSFTKDPNFVKDAFAKGLQNKLRYGGTGYYAVTDDSSVFAKCREEDMLRLEKDPFLNTLPNHRNVAKKTGIDMAHQMPYYHLYDSYIDKKVSEGKKLSYYKDYLSYSIGFLTRGCFRQCPFCVNRLERGVHPYSQLEWFLDNEKDKNGKLLRPYIYLWDDNFLASSPRVWRPLLQSLINSKRPFQFRQGLDERILAESPYGEEIAELLSKCKYHGDYIFAFDNWSDRDKIIKALKIWKRYNQKTTKFYLFCGFKLTAEDDEKLYTDIWQIFARIKILMQYGCLGYIMRHEDFHNHELSNIYVQIARWCNQPAFYKKMSFWEFCYRNQSYWEEHSLKITNRPKLKSFNEFFEDYKNGYYGESNGQVKMCLPLKTIVKFLDRYSAHKEDLLEMFNYKLTDLIDPLLWNPEK